MQLMVVFNSQLITLHCTNMPSTEPVQPFFALHDTIDATAHDIITTPSTQDKLLADDPPPSQNETLTIKLSLHMWC